MSDTEEGTNQPQEQGSDEPKPAEEEKKPEEAKPFRFVPRQVKRGFRRGPAQPAPTIHSSSAFAPFKDDLMYKIFSFLELDEIRVMSEVCAKWREIIRTHHPALDLTGGTIKPLAVRSVLQSFSSIKKLKIPIQHSAILLSTVADNCPNLESLLFSHPAGDINTNISQNVAELGTLLQEEIQNRESHASHTDTQPSSSPQPTSTSPEVSPPPESNGENSVSARPLSPIRSPKAILPSGVFNKIPDAKLKDLVTKCPKLTTVDLSYCSMVTDKGVSHFSLGSSDLRYVNLNGSLKITDKSVQTLLQRNISPQANVSPLIFLGIAHNPQLTTLSLKAIGIACAQSKTSLKSVVLNHNPQFTPHDLTYIIKGGAGKEYLDSKANHSRKQSNTLTSLSWVERLDLSGTNINDSALEFILSFTPTLRILLLSHCPQLTTQAAEVITSNASQLLELVDLRGNPQILQGDLEEMKCKLNIVVWSSPSYL
ncbi:hypothetical protein BLNAU_11313 [Blattamonas nauphoetae]|uniref:F-box domain-containing protein n=1 Tax=Blattamonas nauphoetae TaxID=2049346 RepID=A0ABQ9XSK4_9EUKA|nr:hypothetical protein BLNAU_11313 [Blattamonas nauphoetae]